MSQLMQRGGGTVVATVVAMVVGTEAWCAVQVCVCL